MDQRPTTENHPSSKTARPRKRTGVVREEKQRPNREKRMKKNLTRPAPLEMTPKAGPVLVWHRFPFSKSILACLSRRRGLEKGTAISPLPRHLWSNPLPALIVLKELNRCTPPISRQIWTSALLLK